LDKGTFKILVSFFFFDILELTVFIIPFLSLHKSENTFNCQEKNKSSNTPEMLFFFFSKASLNLTNG